MERILHCIAHNQILGRGGDSNHGKPDKLRVFPGHVCGIVNRNHEPPSIIQIGSHVPKARVFDEEAGKAYGNRYIIKGQVCGSRYVVHHQTNGLIGTAWRLYPEHDGIAAAEHSSQD